MASHEALDAPEGCNAVSANASPESSEVRHLEPAGPIEVPVPGYAPRNCIVCHQALGVGERKLHVGRCARQRKTALQRFRRERGRE